MAVSHVFSDAIANWTGTVTVFDSAGNTGTVAATNLVRPQDWNSAHNQFYTLTGNTTGNTTASGTNVIFAGSGGISVGGSTGTVVISGPAPVTHSNLDLFSNIIQNAAALQQGSLIFHPATLPNVQFDRVGLRIVHTNATNSSGSWTLTQLFGIYTKTGSSLSLLTSTSTTVGVTNSGTVGVFSSVGGPRLLTIPMTTTLTEGDYWIGIMHRSTSGGADCSVSQIVFSRQGAQSIISSYSGIFSVASNASAQPNLGFGYYSVSTGTLPNSVGFSELQGTNATLLRHQLWLFASGTA